MPFGVTFKLSGRRQIVRNLKKLPRTMQRRTLTKALAAGAGVLKRAAIARTPERTKLLKRSLRAYRLKNVQRGVIAYRIQPKRMKRAIRKTKGGKLRVATAKKQAELEAQGAKLQYADPANYGHLVELGTKRTRARHFMEKAFRAAKRRAEQRIIEKVKAAVKAFRGRP